MKAIIEYNSRKIAIDVSKPIDISIAIDATKENINALRQRISAPCIGEIKFNEIMDSNNIANQLKLDQLMS